MLHMIVRIPVQFDRYTLSLVFSRHSHCTKQKEKALYLNAAVLSIQPQTLLGITAGHKSR